MGIRDHGVIDLQPRGSSGQYLKLHGLASVDFEYAKPYANRCLTVFLLLVILVPRMQGGSNVPAT